MREGGEGDGEVRGRENKKRKGKRGLVGEVFLMVKKT